MIKIKEFTELTEKDKASIRELIDDCIRYEQLELAVPDLNEEDGTAYLYYQSSKNPKLISVLFCYDLEDYLEVSAFTSPAHRCQGAFTSLFQKLMEGYEETPVCFYPDGNSYDALMTMEVLDCEYSGTEHLMRLEKRPEVAVDASIAENNATVTLYPATKDDLLALVAVHSAAFDMEKEDSIAFLDQSFDTGETIWCIAAGGTIAGLVLTSIQPDQTNLYGLAIHPEYQKKGYGRDAVKVLLQKPDITFPVTLHVTEENEAAYKIYKNIGFVTTQELMEYWY